MDFHASKMANVEWRGRRWSEIRKRWKFCPNVVKMRLLVSCAPQLSVWCLSVNSILIPNAGNLCIRTPFTRFNLSTNEGKGIIMRTSLISRSSRSNTIQVANETANKMTWNCRPSPFYFTTWRLGLSRPSPFPSPSRPLALRRATKLE